MICYCSSIKKANAEKIDMVKVGVSGKDVRQIKL